MPLGLTPCSCFEIFFLICNFFFKFCNPYLNTCFILMFSATKYISVLSCYDMLKLYASYCSLGTSYLDAEVKLNPPSFTLTFCPVLAFSATLFHPRAHWFSLMFLFLLSEASFLEWHGDKNLGSLLMLVSCSILYWVLLGLPWDLQTPFQWLERFQRAFTGNCGVLLQKDAD